MDLATMLAPMDKQVFIAEVLGRRHLHLRRGGPSPPALVGMGDLDFLISTLDLSVMDRRRPPIRLRRGRSELFVGNLTRRDGRVDLARIHDAFCQGYSVVLDRVHTRLPSIWSCVRGLEAELGTKVVANLYLTPAHSQGFQPHFDTLDVFVLQIVGAKRWQVYAPLIELPREDDPQAPVGEVIEELVLQPGELLYLPRGFGHAGRSLGETSLQLSIGVKVYTVADALADRLEEMAFQDLRLRQPLRPIGGEEAALEPVLQDFVAMAPDARRGHGTRADELLAPPGTDWSSPVVFSLDATLRRPVEPAWRLIRAGESVVLDRVSGSLKCPAQVEGALRHMLERERFTARELPGLDEASRLQLVSRLLAEGYLVRDEV